MTRINKKISKNVCINTINVSSLAKVTENEYFIFKDFRESELILFSKYKKLWVVKCYPVSRVSFSHLNNPNKCFQDLKITFVVNNETVQGFMGENLIIKNTSVLVDCQSIDQLFMFENSYVKRINEHTKKFEGKFLTHNTQLELNLFNLSKLNFFHSKNIFEKIDFLEEFKKVLFKDDFHFVENSQDKFTIGNSSNIFTSVGEGLTAFWLCIRFYIKVMFYTVATLVLIWVGLKLDLHIRIYKLATFWLVCLLKLFNLTVLKLHTWCSRNLLKKKVSVLKAKKPIENEENIELKGMDFSVKHLTEEN